MTGSSLSPVSRPRYLPPGRSGYVSLDPQPVLNASLARRIDLPAAAEILRTKGWLSKTPADFQQAVLARCRLKKFKAGATVYRMGDPSTGLFGLASGRLSVEIASAERAPYLAFFVEPGDWGGYRGVATGLPRDTNVRATRCSEVLFLSVHAIENLIDEDPRRWRLFGNVSVGDLKRVMSLLDDVLRRDHVQRVIAALLHFSCCRQVTPRNVTQIELDVGQEEVSRIANIGRTATGAVLRELEKAGHIELAYRRILVRAPDALRAQLSD
jgi:CRP/FNR family transcriptional regulator, cyclic AMP receptor protein